MAIDILTVDAVAAESCCANGADGTARQDSDSLATAGRIHAAGLTAASLISGDSSEQDSRGQGRAVSSQVDHVDGLASAATGARAFSSVLSDYCQLTKPRIVVMILVTTVASALFGAQAAVDPVQLVWLLLGTGLVAASAGAANQIWERIIDRRMTRTARRPLPAGRIQLAPAIAFTGVLGVLGTTILFVVFSPVPALVGFVTWFLYVLVYTPMKTRTAWNTTVGAIAGAIPMLIGYTATGGSMADMTGWLLVGILVAWQYPHFMAIAWIYRRQYAEAGFQMSTTVDPSGRIAGIQSVAGSIGLIACGIALCWIPDGWQVALLGTLAAIGSGWPMLRASLQFAYEPGDTAARRLLRKSLLVLPVMLAIVTLRLFW